MVEGPSCKRKAERLQVLCGQRLRNAQDLATMQRCLGEAVLRVCAVGKELFIVFGAAALRLHFGMSGGAEFCRLGAQARPSRQPVTLRCEFSDGCLTVHGATARVVDDRYVATAEARRHRDILSPAFDHPAALALLRAGGQRHVCDIVMDQAVLPGVGNVIKVEGLFAAGVHPLAAAGALPEHSWAALLQGLRDCALRWYAALRGRGRLVKACYGAKQCCRCRGRIMLIREGQLQRVTYFCPRCQPETPGGPAPDPSVKASPPAGAAGASAAAAGQCPAASGKAPVVTAAMFGAGRAAAASGGCAGLQPSGGRGAVSSQAPPAARGAAQQGASRQVITPHCLCRRPCALKQTFKDGPNRERHFFSCEARRCRTFAWLDAQLPSCRHGPARLRRVLKMGPNNGRYFASCPAPKGQGCNLFEWIILDEGAVAEPATHGSGRSSGTLRMQQTQVLKETPPRASGSQRPPGKRPAAHEMRPAARGALEEAPARASSSQRPPGKRPATPEKRPAARGALEASKPPTEQQEDANGSLPTKKRPRWSCRGVLAGACVATPAAPSASKQLLGVAETPLVVRALRRSSSCGGPLICGQVAGPSAQCDASAGGNVGSIAEGDPQEVVMCKQPLHHIFDALDQQNSCIVDLTLD